MTGNKLTIASLAVAGVLAFATGAAHAGGVNWSVSIGVPAPIGVQVYGGPPAYYAAPPVYYAPPPVYYSPQRIYYGPPAPHYFYGAPVVRERWVPARRWDRDRDGIPDRYDRHYNPRGDRDRDGSPNWRDRHDGDWRRH